MSNDQHHTKRYWRQIVKMQKTTLDKITTDVALALLDKGYLCTRWFELLESQRLQAIVEAPLKGMTEADFVRQCESDSSGFAVDGQGNAICEAGTNKPLRSFEYLYRFLSYREGDVVVVPTASNSFTVYTVKGRPQSLKNLNVDPFEVSKSGTKTVKWGTAVWDAKSGYLQVVLRSRPKTMAKAIAELGETVKAKLGFFVEVERVSEKDLLFAEYADRDLEKTMNRWRVKESTVSIAGSWEAVERAIRNEPVSLEKVLEEYRAGGRGGLYAEVTSCLNPDKYEQLVYWYFGALGADRRSVPGKRGRDKGEAVDSSLKKPDADVIASFGQDKCHLVQVKFFQGDRPGEDAGETAIRQVSLYRAAHVEALSGYKEVRASVVCATEGFTRRQRELAKSERVELISGPEFLDRLLEVDTKGLDAQMRSQHVETWHLESDKN